MDKIGIIRIEIEEMRQKIYKLIDDGIPVNSLQLLKLSRKLDKLIIQFQKLHKL